MKQHNSSIGDEMTLVEMTWRETISGSQQVISSNGSELPKSSARSPIHSGELCYFFNYCSSIIVFDERCVDKSYINQVCLVFAPGE